MGWPHLFDAVRPSFVAGIRFVFRLIASHVANNVFDSLWRRFLA